MVALNTSSWTMINYWSSSAGYADYVAQVSVWGKVRSQSISDNTSIVDFKYRKRIYSPTNAYYETAPALWNYNNYLHRIRFSNNAHSASATFAFGRVDYPANKEWSDISISNTSDLWWGSVAHNDDGTCSITYTATGTRPSGTATYEESGTITLPTIARASKPTVSTDALVMGNSLQIATNRASSAFTHTITVTCGGHSVTYNNVGTSVQFVAGSSEWMPYMTSKSMTATVSCTTYNGSTRIGSAQSTSFTLNVDTSIYHPAILSIEHSDINADTVALETEGTYIKGFSNLSLSTTVTVNSADYGSVVQSVKITHNGVTRTFTNDLGVIEFEVAYSTIVGADSIVIKVTDNRGVEVSQTVNLTVIPYDVPKLSAIEIKRVNANNQESETGVYLKYKQASTVFWGSFGQVNNALKIYSRSKLPSAQNYSAWSLEQTISTSGTAQYKSYEITGTCAGEYSSSTQFDVQIKVEDELGNAVLYAKVLEGIPVFAWGPDHFDVYGSVHIHDREDVMKYITLDSDPVEVVPVTFNGAVGGSVNWTVFKFGKLRIATCRWRAASNYTINQQWGSWYYCPNINTPNFPVAFNLVTYQNIRYVGADNGATYTAFAEMNIQVADSSGNTTKTNMGSLNLYRPDSGATVGHPVFTQIVIGTIS